MGKYDSVDRLMHLATEKVAPPKEMKNESSSTHGTRDAEAVLEAQVSSSERGVPVATKPAASTAKAPPITSAEPHISSTERGRQLLGALRPFLPAVGSALRLVDHGGVQAVVRLLPLLGKVGASVTGSGENVAPSVNVAAASVAAIKSSREEGKQQLSELQANIEKRYTALADELKSSKQRFDMQEEQTRRTRESLELAIIEQGSLSHSLHQLANRSRLLTTLVVILLIVVIAQMILLAIFFHR